MLTATTDANAKTIATTPKNNIKEDMISSLSDFLSTMNTKINDRHSLLLENSINETTWYLSTVDEMLKWTANISNGEIIDEVDSVIQMVMMILQDEFRQILERNALPLDGGRLSGSFRSRNSLSVASNDGASEDLESSIDGESRDSFCEGRGSLGEDLCLELMNHNAIFDIKEIADRMIRAGYEMECCQVYINVRREVLYEYLAVLGVDKMSIEEVLKAEWGALDERMRRWVQAIKIVTRVILFGEKQLCDRVFGGSEQIMEVCFVDTTKGCVLQLLNFGEAIVIAERSSEKLFRLLDMYDALADVLLDLQALFSNGSGNYLCSEAQGILVGLGEAAKGTLAEFEKAVQGETSRKPTQCGEVHPMVRYVMNYTKLLVDYSDSLNLLLECGTDKEGDGSAGSPVGHHLQLLISSMETRIEEKSKLYEDGALQYVFLMNNLLYMVQKVKDSELGKILGDQWVRKHRGQIRQYATCYLRASWSKVLSYLKDEGIGSSGSSSHVSKVALQERFKNFNAAFEEIYKTQTAWKVPDHQLRDELQISISENVIPAYRSFMGRFRNHLENGRHAGKYIKYSAEDLENHTSNLFEGMPRDLHNTRRKQTP